ncbi:Conserved phosducin-like protein [Phaffia rhodozyma]|uniref:Conserved phosducin-like protein n=1 Tax=Phaffia rhodozyma TaxID=264483 RepID=A0A0F7SP41_PHARH|nr:Conserved phosducin-like protein [Phaffia rhodozyma]
MVNLNEDSEFRDALIAQGIIDGPAPDPPSPSEFMPTDAELLHTTLSLANPATLQTMAEETPDSDEERLFESYRRKRLGEMRKEEKKARYGRVYPIGRESWSKEVTEGSKVDEEFGDDEDDEGEGKGVGTGVVCLLYKDGEPVCERLSKVLQNLAPRYPRTKFISIIGNKCIENYPDRLLPTLIVYRKGEVTGQIVGGEGILGKGNERDIQNLLISMHGILSTHIPSEANSSNPPRSSARSDEDEDEEDEDEGFGSSRAASSKIRNGGGIGTGTKRVPKGGSRKATVESDDEFDL